jgi:hypothetical protein
VGWRVGETNNVVPLENFYNQFFLPDLLSDVLLDRIPNPPQGGIAALLALPGIDAMVSDGFAKIERAAGQLALCIPAGPPLAQRQRDLGLFHKGERLDLTQIGFTELPDRNDCRFRKEVPDDGTQWDWESVGPPEVSPLSAKPIATIATTVASALFVLTVGVTEYPSASPSYKPLPYSAEDAGAIANFFSSKADSTFKSIHVQSRLLNSDATKEGILAAFETLSRAATENDVVLLFFSGHGKIPVGQQMFYFIPYFTQDSYDNTEFDERTRGISVAMIADALRTIKSRKIMIIVDACESGGVIDSLQKIAQVKERIEKDRLARKATPISQDNVGVFLVAAATPIQLATAANQEAHGLLTYTILEYLNSKISSKTANGMLNYVGTRLPEIAAAHGESQSPLVVALGTDFSLAK